VKQKILERREQRRKEAVSQYDSARNAANALKDPREHDRAVRDADEAYRAQVRTV
jgi:hypothetical protein